MTAVERFQPTVDMNGANRVWECTVIAARGMIVKNNAKLEQAINGLTAVFDYVSDGGGFYTDGSFLQHSKHPYTGGYGKALLSELTSLLYVLGGSKCSVTAPGVRNVYNWIYDSFETVDGVEKSSASGWSETMPGVHWAHIAGDNSGRDIGYYFPGGWMIKGLRETRTGSWNEIQRTGSAEPLTRTYQNL
ncbi:hypothetical protein H7F31_12410 [Paenibacillus sp. PAMC21692]|nr:hypothetical protein H7F31_12410 [Paenibacillus sp. PAMC21692]